jgi:ATP-dependent helicase/DNAse subunit B
MKLLIGPPGSGKTTHILDAVRSRLARGDDRFRLVVPTATMAEHLRNMLAREGLLVRVSRIVTLSRLISSLLPGRKTASGPELEFIVQESLARLRPRSFASTMDTPGLPAALASAIEELAGAGCGPDTWSAMGSMKVWTSPMMADLGRVYADVDADLEQRQLILGPRLHAEAAAAIAGGDLSDCDSLYFDGFYTLSPAEIAFIRSAARHVSLTLTLPEWPGAADVRQSLLASGCAEQRCHKIRPEPRIEVSPAATVHREAEEIARRILALNEQGTAMGEIGVIVRSSGPFSSLLESTLARFGIPVRSYLAQSLASHPVAVWIARLADAVRADWEHGAALDVLRNPAFRAGLSPAIEDFTAKVIEAMPASGIDRLQAIASALPGAEAIQQTLATLSATGDWAQKALAPVEWAEAIKDQLALAAPPDGTSPEAVRISRARAAAITSVAASLDETAAFLGNAAIGFEAFWSHAARVIQSASLRPTSTRRDAVALMDAYEARQWELPVVFVAGLLEGEFPRRPRIEPILPNDLRIRANQSGIALRTRDDREQEERFLFSLALSRATRLTVLSYPRFDATGEETLRSFVLESLQAAPVPPVPVRIRASRPAPIPPPPVLLSNDAIRAVRVIHETHSGTALESFLSCPFVFFARNTLALEDPPAQPPDRLDMRETGSLVHAVIAEWHKLGRGPIDAVFDSHWKRLVARLRVPEGYHSEFERLRALRALRHYAANPQVGEGFLAAFEEKVRIKLPSGETVKGRIDRTDSDSEGNCRVIDFKYSRSGKLARLKALDDAGALLQLGIYMAALRDRGLNPVAAAYVPLRSAENWKFKENAEEMIQIAIGRADSAATRILSGEIAPSPAIDDVCEYCEMSNACRIVEIRRGLAGAAGAA